MAACYDFVTESTCVIPFKIQTMMHVKTVWLVKPFYQFDIEVL